MGVTHEEAVNVEAKEGSSFEAVEPMEVMPGINTQGRSFQVSAFLSGEIWRSLVDTF